VAIYTMKDGALRLYDSTTTPFYAILKFLEGGMTGPEGRARPEERIVHDRGNLSTQTHHIDGPDDPITEPLQVTWSLLLDEASINKQGIRDALNIDLAVATTSWSVGADTWKPTKVRGATSFTSGKGSSIAPVAFADSYKASVNVEVVWDDPDGSGAIGRKFEGVHFPPDQQSITEGEEGIVLNLVGLVYGVISELTVFTSGNETTL